MIGYGTENPAYADACIYGNRFPVCNIGRRRYEEEEEFPPDMFDATVEIDTHELNEDEINELAGSIEDVSDKFNIVFGDTIDDEGACYAKITVNGFALVDDEYFDFINVILGFNVKFKESVREHNGKKLS